MSEMIAQETFLVLTGDEEEQLFSKGRKAGLLRAAEMAEAWAASEDGAAKDGAGKARWRFVDGADALRRLGRRLRQEAEE